jgi:hypothetical protein
LLSCYSGGVVTFEKAAIGHFILDLEEERV